MSRLIHPLKKTLLPFPGLWLPNSPFPGALGMSPGYPCCCEEDDRPDCSNPWCDGSKHTPIEFELDMPHLLDLSCDDCGAIEGLIVVRLVEDPIFFDPCTVWEYRQDICGQIFRVTMRITEAHILVGLDWSFIDGINWRTSRPDDKCDEWNDITVSFLDHGNPFNRRCNGFGTSVLLNAL